MADRIGIKTEGFDRALKMMKQTAPDEAKKQVRASMRFATNRVKSKLKASAPRDPTGRSHFRSGKFYAPHLLSRKGIVSRSKTDSRGGSFIAKIHLTSDAFYGWILNVGRYMTGGTWQKSSKMRRGVYYVRLMTHRYEGWIDRAISPRKVANEAIKEFSRRFGK